jgi:hypothetical protein
MTPEKITSSTILIVDFYMVELEDYPDFSTAAGLSYQNFFITKLAILVILKIY